MSLAILTDNNIRDVLSNLTLEDVQNFQESLREALHEYSTGTQDQGACAIHQPERTSVLSPGGVTSLFMPSISSAGIGMKVVSLNTSASHSTDTTPHGSITLMTPNGTPYAFLNAAQLTAFRTALTSSLLVSRRSRPKTLLVFGSGNQAYWHLRLSLIIHGHSIKNIHIITRTLSSKSAALMKSLHHIPYEIKKKEGWADMKIGMLTPAYGEYNRLLLKQIRSADIIFCTTPSREPLFHHEILSNKEGRMKGRLIVAIGSYTPEMIEIPSEIIRQATKETHKHHHHKHAQEGGVVVVDTLSGAMKEAGEVIQAGLEKHQLVELGELVMLESQNHNLDLEDGVSDIDINEGPSTPTESRSSMDMTPLSPSSPRMRPSSPFRSPSSQRSSPSLRPSLSSMGISKSASSSSLTSLKSTFLSIKEKSKKSNCDALCRWLRDGNVVYKSVGMGLMDLVVGDSIVKLAGEKGVGSFVEEF